MKNHYKDNYKEYAAPFFWWFKADQLLAASEVVLATWEQANNDWLSDIKGDGRVRLTEKQQKAHRFIHIHHVYLFLVGLAFENILKGIIIGRDPSMVLDENLSKFLKGPHTKLLSWFNAAGVHLNENERNLVERLGENVQWAGRYPISTKAEDMTLRPVPGMGFTTPGNFIHGDPDLIEAIKLRLIDVVNNDHRLPKYTQIDPIEDVEDRI